MLKSGNLISELSFSTSRSSGPGGQNVNKVNSKVTLRFDVANSIILTEDQKNQMLLELSSRLTGDGVLILSSQTKRSQLQNKEALLVRLDGILSKVFKVVKPRKKSKPSKRAMEKRLKGKRIQKEKKERRRKL